MDSDDRSLWGFCWCWFEEEGIGCVGLVSSFGGDGSAGKSRSISRSSLFWESLDESSLSTGIGLEGGLGGSFLEED